MKIYLIRTGKCLPVLMSIVVMLMLNIGIASNAVGDIQVYHTSATSGNEINSDGSYDFGSHLVGETVIQTFVIKNTSGTLVINPTGPPAPSLPAS
ncbi:MAG: hypothetical protein BWK80_24920 [Desulfobacteraceae bacterium IS3]|nr:MAG: hypothetical protein BWK80_24920 [Desulfobacteraceae bacterium IS3]